MTGPDERRWEVTLLAEDHAFVVGHTGVDDDALDLAKDLARLGWPYNTNISMRRLERKLEAALHLYAEHDRQVAERDEEIVRLRSLLLQGVRFIEAVCVHHPHEWLAQVRAALARSSSGGSDRGA